MARPAGGRTGRYSAKAAGAAQAPRSPRLARSPPIRVTISRAGDRREQRPWSQEPHTPAQAESPAAKNDLKGIDRYGPRQWGKTQSEGYLSIMRNQSWLLTRQPLMGIGRPGLFARYEKPPY